MKWPDLQSTDTYPLWGFTNGNRTVYTRGRTIEEAWNHAKQNFVGFKTIWILADLNLRIKDAYIKTHQFDWYHSPMQWLLKESIK